MLVVVMVVSAVVMMIVVVVVVMVVLRQIPLRQFGLFVWFSGLSLMFRKIILFHFPKYLKTNLTDHISGHS